VYHHDFPPRLFLGSHLVVDAAPVQSVRLKDNLENRLTFKTPLRFHQVFRERKKHSVDTFVEDKLDDRVNIATLGHCSFMGRIVSFSLKLCIFSAHGFLPQLIEAKLCVIKWCSFDLSSSSGNDELNPLCVSEKKAE
jgi:hypothetical protein